MCSPLLSIALDNLLQEVPDNTLKHSHLFQIHVKVLSGKRRIASVKEYVLCMHLKPKDNIVHVYSKYSLTRFTAYLAPHRCSLISGVEKRTSGTHCLHMCVPGGTRLHMGGWFISYATLPPQGLTPGLLKS